METKKKIVVILGPTASGKSALAISLAKKFNGEVVSADSRQVYKGLDIGTGKVTKKEMNGIPHHMLDIVSPKTRYTVDLYKKSGSKKISDILSRGKLPIICGGTGFYIEAVVDNVALPDVGVNKKLRAALGKKSAPVLYAMLKKLDKKRAAQLDPRNKVRIIRAIEIAKALGKVPSLKKQPLYDSLQIGIETPDEMLKKKINLRLKKRIAAGMIAEAKKLHETGLSWKRMEELGLEYRFLAKHLQGELSKDEMTTRLEFGIWDYARRQKSWFRRDKRIKWFRLKKQVEISKEIKRFLG